MTAAVTLRRRVYILRAVVGRPICWSAAAGSAGGVSGISSAQKVILGKRVDVTPRYPPPVATVLRGAVLAFTGFALTPTEAAAYRTLVASALLEEAAYLFAEAGKPDCAAEAISAARHAEGVAIVAGAWLPPQSH